MMANLFDLALGRHQSGQLHAAGADFAAVALPAGYGDSHRHPGHRLYRQPHPGDWHGVFARIAIELADWVRRRGDRQ
jgi:hypothetical protein